jgi:hypothetical protein
MKRYLVTLLLVPLIVLGIGTYYIQASTRVLPQFILEPIEGNKSLASQIQVYAQFANSRDFINRNVTIQEAGSHYEERTIINELTSNSSVLEMDVWKKLVEGHKSFMRGKRSLESMYADEKQLVYVKVENDDLPYFHVSMLDKATLKESSYMVKVPEGHEYHLVQIQEVLIAGDQIKVTTDAYRRDSNTGDIILYSLPLTQETAEVNYQVLYSRTSPTGDILTNIRKIYDSNMLRPGRYMGYYLEKSKEIHGKDGSYHTQSLGVELLIWDAFTGEKVSVFSSELVSMLEQKGEAEYVDTHFEGDSLFVAKYSPEEFNTLKYDFTEKKTTFLKQVGNYRSSLVHHEDRLYMLRYETKESPIPEVVVLDMKTGTPLFKGRIVLQGADPNPEQTLAKLQLSHIGVR